MDLPELQDRGRDLYRFLYIRFVRPLLPKEDFARVNDVKVANIPIAGLDRRVLGDAFVERRDEEGGIVEAHRLLTRDGDRIVIVGGGMGVTAVRAARMVGDAGAVEVFEGGGRRASSLRRTLELNGVATRCRVHHAVVGEAIHVYGGESEGASRLDDRALPDCDVLELDCEGAELGILTELEISPRCIICELHPWHYPDRAREPVRVMIDRGYRLVGLFGHDGKELTEENFWGLLQESTTKGRRRLEKGGARWPVVVAASRKQEVD